ncbi:MAG: efflux RND transporter periplasmic adaptor subunit [Lachnospiraceae bacterium]|nr:efflux RND transporter periplasmic adaptor subunit [Lachnospiraceae bacterium]
MEEKMSRAEKKMAQNSITTKDKEETGMTGMDSQETKTTPGGMAAGAESGTETGKGRKKKQKEPKIKKPMEKARKKKIIRRSILGGVALVIAFFVVANSMAAQNMGLMVSTVSATVQDVEQNLSTSGTVKSEETKTYFAPVAVEVGTVDVAAGDSVKKGQSLLRFDADALAEAKQMAQLKLQANEGGYNSSIYKNNKYIADLGEANVNLGVLEQQIADSENYVKELEQKINDKKAAIAHEGTLLQISLLDWSDKPDSEEYLNLQKLIQYNSYEQQNNKEVAAWQKEIDTYQEMIAAYKEYRSEMKSQKSASEGGSMDSGSRSQLEANTEMEKMNNQDTLTALAEVENGMQSDFNGVVTEVEIVEGSTPQEGQKLLTVESTEKVKVEITVSKYDLDKIAVGQEAEINIAGKEYKGKVSKINRMATTNASGAAVVGAEVAIENPDQSIFLGVEAKVEVHMATATDVVTVPVEVVNTDREGDFVFVAEEGMVKKKRVTTGISSDTDIEIQEGLTAGEAVIMTTGQELEEGTPVTVLPQNPGMAE